MSAANSRRVGSGRLRPQAAPEDYDRDGPGGLRGEGRGDRGDRDVGPRGERGGRSNYGERGDPASESRYGFNRGDRGDRDRGNDRGGWNDRDYDKGGRGDPRSDRGGRNMTSTRGGRYEQQGGSTGRPEHDPKGDRRGDPRNERGHRGSRRNEEPEWMSEPIKQDGELFELKGFDDSPEKETKGMCLRKVSSPFGNRWRWRSGYFSFRHKTLIGQLEVPFYPGFFFTTVLVLIFKPLWVAEN